MGREEKHYLGGVRRDAEYEGKWRTLVQSTEFSSSSTESLVALQAGRMGLVGLGLDRGVARVARLWTLSREFGLLRRGFRRRRALQF